MQSPAISQKSYLKAPYKSNPAVGTSKTNQYLVFFSVNNILGKIILLASLLKKRHHTEQGEIIYKLMVNIS